MLRSSALRSLALLGATLGAAALVAPGALAQQRNCLDTLAGMPNYSRMVNAVTRSHMVNDMRTMQNITFFAPTNDAINQVNPALVDRLFPRGEQGDREADPILATAAVQAHIVQGRFPGAALSQGVQLTTQAGSVLTFGRPSGSEQGATISTASGASARIVQADIPCSNGMIHGIDHVLIR